MKDKTDEQQSDSNDSEGAAEVPTTVLEKSAAAPSLSAEKKQEPLKKSPGKFLAGKTQKTLSSLVQGGQG